MGGGGAMRAAAKLAGIGVATGGLRGIPLTPSVEQSVKNVQRPVSVALSSQGGKTIEMAPTDKSAASPSLDDWESARDDELILESPKLMPTFVFGGVPSFQDAKEATEELKDALEKVYLSSSNSTALDGSFAGNNVSRLPVVSNPVSETKSCVTENIVAHSVSSHALHAFRLLSTSPETQNVIASITCDPKVWNAVMDNSAVKEFFQSQLTDSGSHSQVKECDEDFEVSSICSSKIGDAAGEGNGVDDCKDFMQNIRLKVVELVGNVSSFLQNIFGFPGAASGNDTENPKANHMDNDFVGMTFMGLAVMTAMLVVLRRA